MRFQAAIITTGISALLLAGSAGLAMANDPLGQWTTENGKGRVRITNCGAALCGNLAWLSEPNDDKGQPKKDIHNVDESKRARPMLGVPILLSMAKDGDKRWKGNIYNAEDGKTYTAYLTPESDTKLKVEGCVLGGLVCKTQIWTRAR
jgi:uncharacterized protein (DUF2147 family)